MAKEGKPYKIAPEASTRLRPHKKNRKKRKGGLGGTKKVEGKN